jgi:hypothetical protein
MTLEENVLAYLDGSLGEEESAELLHTLSVSPEKRALLEEHLRMTNMLSLGRKPFAVPAAAERELIARLPFLADIPRPVPFYAKPMALAASAAAVLAVIGGLWWNANRIDAPIATKLLANSEAPVVQNGNRDIRDFKDTRDLKANQPTTHAVKREHAVKQHVAVPAESTPSIQNEVAVPLEASASNAIASNDPAGAISEALLKASDIPTPSVHSPRTLHEVAFGVPDRLRPFSVGVSSMASGYYLPSLNGGVNSSFGLDPQLNISYDITQWFAFGLEAGYTQFGNVTNSYKFAPLDGTAYSELAYQTQVVPTSTGYVRAALHFTVDPTADYPIRFGAAGGYAFNNTSDPCAAVSAGVTRTLSDDLSLDLDMVLSGLWSTQVDQSPTNITGITGIVHRDTRSQAPFTSAFGLRAGIRYRP